MLGAVAGGAGGGGGRALGPCRELRSPSPGGRRRAWAKSPRPSRPALPILRSQQRRACTSANGHQFSLFEDFFRYLVLSFLEEANLVVNRP